LNLETEIDLSSDLSPSTVPELIGFAVDVTDCGLTFGSALNFIYLIRALFNRNVLALADPSMQLWNACLHNGLKSAQFEVCR
jgi:hypothetical protein